jgi:hypothetical protein
MFLHFFSNIISSPINSNRWFVGFPSLSFIISWLVLDLCNVTHSHIYCPYKELFYFHVEQCFTSIYKLHKEFNKHIYHFLLWNQYQYPYIATCIVWALDPSCGRLTEELTPTFEAKEIVYSCIFQNYVTNTYFIYSFQELFGAHYCV